MIANVEDALLLLKKWQADSSLVIALIGRPSMIVRIEGTTSIVEDDGSFCIDAGPSFIYASIANCKINDAATNEVAEMMKDHLPPNWEDGIHMVFPEGGGLTLFGAPRPILGESNKIQ